MTEVVHLHPNIRRARPGELAVLQDIDDDSCDLYHAAGLAIDLSPEHAFVVAERARWTASLAAGDVFAAVDADDAPVGFAALTRVDGAPYLDQLSVRCAAMRRGLGGQLLTAAIAWASARSSEGLWLNTYGHLAWNAPFYARHGFVLVPEAAWRPQMCAIVAEQRAALPAPHHRVVMHRA
jgi:GNAT superfamily N-acetyltransferase